MTTYQFVFALRVNFLNKIINKEERVEDYAYKIERTFKLRKFLVPMEILKGIKVKLRKMECIISER